MAAGAAEVAVARRPRVRVLCTGDELRDPGEPLGPGEIHNSNGPMLVSLAGRAGASTAPSGRLPDDRGATEAALREALAEADVLVISGGVSVGPHDHVKPALAALGAQERFWRVSLQPGGPTWFGTYGEKLVFGLPGNPVSAYVTFSLFAHPALTALQGAPVEALADAEAITRRACRAQPPARTGGPGPPRAPRRQGPGGPQRPPGVSHDDFAARRRRAGHDPAGRGRGGGGHYCEARLASGITTPGSGQNPDR